MESSSHEALALVAEVAVALAGFSSVVVTLENRGVSAWTAIQRFNLRILLQVSALAIFFSLFPLILERVASPPWRWALSIYGAVHLADVSSFILRRPPQATATHRVTSYLGLLISLVSLAVAALGSPLAAEVTYLGVLVWHLAVASMGFAFLLFDDDDERAARPPSGPHSPTGSGTS
jgi:hypothetical protein